MQQWPYVALALIAGAGVALQAAVNTRLRNDLSQPMLATFISFTVGAIAAFCAWMVAQPRVPAAEAFARLPAWAWTGGLLGVLYVASSVIAIPRLGVAAMLALVVAGQTLTSMTLDNFGWLGAPEVVTSPGRAIGAALVIAGAAVLAMSR